MSWKNDQPSDKQLEFINDLGYFLAPPRTKGEASLLIDALKAGLSPEAVQDRLFRFQAGLPLEPLPERGTGEISGCLVIAFAVMATVTVFVTIVFLACGGCIVVAG